MEKLMIFDLDGTLIDSRKDIANSLNFALKEQGYPTLSQEKIESLVGRGAETLVNEAMGSNRAEDFQRVFLSFLAHYENNSLSFTQLYAHAIDFIRASSTWRKAIVTNKPFLHTDKILKGLKVDHYFEWVIGSDSLPVMKPDPKVLNPIKNELGKISQGVMIGDSKIDIELGKLAGLTTCALTHGFGKTEELEAAEPDFLVDSFVELQELPIFL